MMNKGFTVHRTVPIEEILNIVAGAIRNAMLDSGPCPAIIKNPLHLVNLVREGEKRRRANSATYGIPVPRFCIFSVTWKCNLSCTGCYAKGYTSEGSLDNHEIVSIIREASELGAFIFLIAGGEPFTVPDIINVLSGVPKAFFLVFTNGTLITAEHIHQLAGSTNIMPIFSVDGDASMNDGRTQCSVFMQQKSVSASQLWLRTGMCVT
jgi:sulfatase maturation enzyme AslB (radical SAM superfamily)